MKVLFACEESQECTAAFREKGIEAYSCGSASLPLWSNQTKSGQNKLPPSKDRAKLRYKTYQGIAEAMANQWCNI